MIKHYRKLFWNSINSIIEVEKMILKLTNKDKNFYEYMGKFFGSRLVQRQTNDRIFDDPDKVWYIYKEGNKIVAFVSIQKSTIKNIYSTKEEYLEKLLERIKKENKITNSIVTNSYKNLYERCGFFINNNSNLKNFVTICTEQINENKNSEKEKLA